MHSVETLCMCLCVTCMYALHSMTSVCQVSFFCTFALFIALIFINVQISCNTVLCVMTVVLVSVPLWHKNVLMMFLWCGDGFKFFTL